MAVTIVSGGRYSTGELAATMELQGPKVYGEQVRGAVGNRSDHALVVHNGASVHDIFPIGVPHVYQFSRRGRPQLRFLWRGRIAFFPQIPGAHGTIGRSHPGMRGKRYLEIPLEVVGRRHGFKVTIRPRGI